MRRHQGTPLTVLYDCDGELAMQSRFQLSHVPALDGLRGLAVLGVLAFHSGVIPGGYLGVDLFFVLSGFLITCLLLRERDDSGRVRLREFWRRRARRLLPALFALFALVALYTWLSAPAFERNGIRGDMWWTLLYMANWHAIVSGQGYWDLFNAPSPLEHTWSLAIEEQFYLLWPLVFLGLFAVCRGRARSVQIAVAVGAVALAAWSIALYARTGDATRVYLGTDTRAPAILFGAFVALVLFRRGPVRTTAGRVALEVAGALALAGLVVAWCTVPGRSDALYLFVLPACGVGAALVIAAVVQPDGRILGRALSWRPLCWVGLISYGLYLYHWPVFVWIKRSRVAEGWVRVVVEINISFALAIISFFVLERPIRRRGLAAWRIPILAPVAAVASVALVLFATAGGIARPGSPGIDDMAGGAGDMGTLVPLQGAPGSVPARVGTTSVPERPAVVSPGPVSRATSRPTRVLVVGDSVSGGFAENFAARAANENLVVGDRSLFGCEVDAGDGRRKSTDGSIDSEPARCAPWRASWANDVATFSPDAVVLLWGGALFGQRWVDGAWHGYCDGAMQARMRAGYATAIETFGSGGATVFLVRPAYPDSAFLPSESGPNHLCGRAVIDEVLAQHPGVRAVALDEWTCPAGQGCLESRDGVRLRDDGVHYDRESGGLELAASWLFGQMLQPRR